MFNIIGKSYTPEEVYKYVNNKHRRGWEHKSYEDSEAIYEHDYFVLALLNLDDTNIRWSNGQHPPVIKKYSQLPTDFPPIVLNHENYILDGTHRVSAARLRGDTQILALVGVKRNLDERKVIFKRVT